MLVDTGINGYIGDGCLQVIANVICEENMLFTTGVMGFGRWLKKSRDCKYSH